MSQNEITGIGLVGLGNVGSGTLGILAENAAAIERKLGFPLTIAAACSRSVHEAAPSELDAFPGARRTPDWRSVVDDPKVGIVAELVGGTTVAAEIVEAALRAGKSVVTANKELIAARGPELEKLASENNAALAMEASVAGGIPILTSLREGIAGDKITAMLGILNGTCNYILTSMESRGDSFDKILKEAQELGYAEADPSADVDGYDARAKLAILVGLAFGARVEPENIYLEGIRQIRAVDFAYARQIKHTVRLVAIAQAQPEGLLLAVRPVLVPTGTILAHVEGSYNAVWALGEHGVDTFYYGRGAGPRPTGVAVVSDLMAVARDMHAGVKNRVSPFAFRDLENASLVPAGELIRPYYLRFRVRDRPGIIHELAQILSESGISIDAVLQLHSDDKQDLPFVITLEPAAEKAVRSAVDRMRDLPFLVDAPLALPMERALGD